MSPTMTKSRKLAAVCIVANALTAGSIFCWPVFGPRIREDLGLSLTETNAIWSAAVVGQYASSAFMGSISDQHGPRPLSLLAALLFGGGYFLMAQTERGVFSSHEQSFIAMALFFVLVGAGVAASLFAALSSSSAHFKSHPGLAISIPLTLFSLSSLFLSSIASLSFFANPATGDLDSPRWLASLGAGLTIVNVFSAYGLSRPDEHHQEDQGAPPIEAAAGHPGETTPLLPASATEPPAPAFLAYSVPLQHPSAQSNPSTPPLLTATEFAKTPSAWILGFVLFAAVGASEMVMSSIGSMVFSLQAVKASWQGDDDIGRDTLLIRTRQVQLIAIANTASRLFIGLASDMVSPSRSKRQYQSAWKGHLLNIRISRVAMLLSGLALLAVTFTVAGLALNSIDQLWIVSIATGLGYGLVFTIVPTLIMRAWPRQFGRNFGLLNYLAALGSLSFSMLFAYINDSVAVSTSSLTTTTTTATCRLGRRCFEPSFLIAAFTLYACFFFTLPLYRAWRHVV